MKKGTTGFVIVVIGVAAIMSSCKKQEPELGQEARIKALEIAGNSELCTFLAPPLGAKWVRFVDGKVSGFGTGYGGPRGPLGFDFGAELDISKKDFSVTEKWPAERVRVVARHFAREIRRKIPDAYIVRGMSLGQRSCFATYVVEHAAGHVVVSVGYLAGGEDGHDPRTLQDKMLVAVQSVNRAEYAGAQLRVDE